MLFRSAETAYHFRNEKGVRCATLTYGGLLEKAARTSQLLADRQGQRALLLLPPGPEYTVAFFACQLAGVVAVPLYPPRRNASLERITYVARDCQATLAISNSSVHTKTFAQGKPDAYLNDTLAAVEGAAAIEAYFARSLESATALRVRFLDTARSGADYYIRWEMLVEASGLNGGKPVVSYGVSQLRFDAEGRVLVHKDFWDAATGLHEQLPVVGSLVRRVRAAVESE